MKANILLCSDLDRTILPNGAQPESPQARTKLRLFADRPELMLVYVSGRHAELIREAISEYHIPLPDFAIGDVGTTIYHIRDDRWHPWQEWSEAIAPDWNGAQHADLAALFNDLKELQLQEAEKQNTFKLSYYTQPELDHDALIGEMSSRLRKHKIKASLIWSVDESANVGLLDVLPESATKLHAVQFLRERQGFQVQQTVFAGDSGNDLPVVTSGELQSVLVKNAHPDVIHAAKKALQEKGASEQLYVAQGGFLQMNGNYSAGVLEGVVHFLPQTKPWLE
jgi:hypothetical protein